MNRGDFDGIFMNGKRASKLRGVPRAAGGRAQKEFGNEAKRRAKRVKVGMGLMAAVAAIESTAAAVAVGMRTGIVAVVRAGPGAGFSAGSRHREGAAIGRGVAGAAAPTASERREADNNGDRRDKSNDQYGQRCVIHETSLKGARLPGSGSARSTLFSSVAQISGIFNSISLCT